LLAIAINQLPIRYSPHRLAQKLFSCFNFGFGMACATNGPPSKQLQANPG
jgi:hypothetical protein